MGWAAAWHNEIFRAYLYILAAVLAAAGGILAVLDFALGRNIRPISRIYRSWLVMAPLVVFAVGMGRVTAIVFFGVVAIIAFKEFARATGLYRDWWMTGAVYMAIAGVDITSIVNTPVNGPPGWYGLFMTLPVYAVALFIMIPILRNETRGQLQSMALAITGFTYIGWMFMHLAFLANATRSMMYGYILYLIFAVELNDVAAFTFGTLLGRSGRHKLRSAISPNKTWEGAIGAFALSMALPWVMRFSLPQFGTTQLILTGLIVGIGGQLGDLSISVIKRDIGIKDMGAIIPGHGGVLDRIDSLIYTAPLFLHMADYFFNIWR